MSLEAVVPPGYAIPGLSQAMFAEGRLLFLSGHVPLSADGTLVAPGKLEEQLVSIFDNLSVTLKAAGGSFDNVARLTTYIVNYTPAAIPILRDVRNRYINLQRPPASTLLGVAALFHPDCVAEVEAIAVLPR
jgi:2-iminobutanoate/2-iminopropanoate deaminase